MKKKALSSIAIILIVATLFGALPLSAFAANHNSEYFPKYTGKSSSIVTVLKAIGVNSSFSNRKIIAVENGISNYSGTASQNLKLVSLAKSGKLKNPSYTPPVSNSNNSTSSNNSSANDNTTTKYYPKYTGKSGSIVSALNAIGVNSSYSYRAKIAAANNISGYRGTAAQNTKMVSLLKTGKLINPDAKLTHSHSMRSVDGTNLRYCGCGYFDTQKTGVVQQGYSVALPNNGYVISPADVAVALAALKASLSVSFSSLGAVLTNPFVVIPLVVSGVAIYAYLNCSTTSAEVIDVKKMTSDYRPDKLEYGKFYYSAIFHGKGYTSVLILYNDGFDINHAKSYMTKVALGTTLLKETVDNYSIDLGSVYTVHPQDAKDLCEALKRTGYFRYGGDKCADEDLGFNRKMVDNILYYVHFHLFFDRYRTGLTHNYKKITGSHVFFAYPYARRTASVT